MSPPPLNEHLQTQIFPLEEITYPIKFCLLVLLEKGSLQLPRLQICLLDLAPTLPLTYVRLQPTVGIPLGCMSLKLQLVRVLLVELQPLESTFICKIELNFIEI